MLFATIFKRAKSPKAQKTRLHALDIRMKEELVDMMLLRQYSDDAMLGILGKNSR